MQPVRFEKRLIAEERYEAAAVFDVNNDGVPDIVSGAWWYPGPDFTRREPVSPLDVIDGEYYDCFAHIPVDVNGDGYLDFVTGGWWGKTLRWHENPRGTAGAEWPVHEIAEVGNIETIRAWDVDGDGELEIVPNTPGGPLRIFKLVKDNTGRATGEFRSQRLFDGPCGHGLGFGDINNDGRPDFVLAKGWLEAPENPVGGTWTFHPEFDLGSASVPILVADVNGDGLNDLIVGQAHGYGLDWWEQQVECNGTRRWIRHPIDPYCSQYHDLRWLDADGDGQAELITGKRYRAHCGRDPGGADPVGVYCFKWTGENFAKQVIDYGPPSQGAGCGIFFAMADLNGDGRPDLVAPGKDGLHLFRNTTGGQP
ncbi:MAG: VCBS repeat-containing protein [Kiritimatiellaeota bacterium]|nr:VCBS repeat-containing protein [Kiritimatiellota bacterium]